MNRCRFPRSMTSITTCSTHGWSGPRSEVERRRTCPAAGGSVDRNRLYAALLTIDGKAAGVFKIEDAARFADALFARLIGTARADA